jgi:flavin reductase (DIM6/NTAB) family NADH-FMN oxidoreductase RutF
MVVDFKDNSTLDRYKLMSNFIIPRPIAWIVTKADVVNIAPFSYFAPISSDPPSLIVSIGHKRDRTPKDTLRNIREQKKCVVSIIEDDHLELLKLSSKELYRDVSEAEMFGISTSYIFDDFPPVPDGVKVAFFCELIEEIDLKNSDTRPLLLEIKYLYHDENMEDFKAVGRVGLGFCSS